MGNPVYKEKDKKMSFLRQVIRRSAFTSSAHASNHPLRSLLDPLVEDAELDSLVDLETVLLDNINPRIISMSVDPEESAEEVGLRERDFQDLSETQRIPARSSFYRWQSLRGTRPLRSSFVTASRIPRSSLASIFSRAHLSNTLENNNES